jgi:hypothetical protein
MPIRLRYDASCHMCNKPLTAGTYAVWDGDTKTATCLVCVNTSRAVAPGDDEPLVAALPTGQEPLSIRLRYSAVCSACSDPMPPGSEARWDNSQGPKRTRPAAEADFVAERRRR